MPKQPHGLSRDKMIEDICEDMQSWLKRDPSSFWDHVQDLERGYLKEKGTDELKDIYESSL